MEADNHKCGVGVAYEARIGGIKMLDGVVNDRVEAEALGYRHDLVDIYTASWGPPDDGKSLDTPGRLATEALERGAQEVIRILFYFFFVLLIYLCPFEIFRFFILAMRIN